MNDGTIEQSTINNQPSDNTCDKICAFFENRIVAAASITTGILCPALGVSFLTTYIGARLAKLSLDSDAIELTQQIQKFTISQIEEKYQQYAKNPTDTTVKQAMIDIFKHSNPCMIFQFLVKHMPYQSQAYTNAPTIYKSLPQNLQGILQENSLNIYNTFISLYHSMTDDIVQLNNIIRSLQSVLTNPCGDNSHIQTLNSGTKIVGGHSPLILLACNIFTDHQLDKICNNEHISEDIKQAAQDTKALRSFIKGLSTEQLQAIQTQNYSPKEFSEILGTKQPTISEACLQYFQGDHGTSALQILIGQELMTRG